MSNEKNLIKRNNEMTLENKRLKFEVNMNVFHFFMQQIGVNFNQFVLKEIRFSQEFHELVCCQDLK